MFRSLKALTALGLGLALAWSANPSAAATNSVVIYNAVSTKLIQAFVEEFQKQNPGVKAEVISGGSGELLTRIKAERSNPRGDVLVGPDADVFDADLSLFDSYDSKQKSGFDKAAIGPDGKYYGFSTNFQAFIVNTKAMPLDKAPKSWADLAKPEFKGKILMANPAQSGSAYSQMHQILMLYGWDVMAKIIQNATFVPSSKLAFQNVAKGEIAVGLTSEFNILVSKLDGNPVEAVYPSDGTALIIDANGIIKGGPNLENARKFIDFISSAQAHKILVDLDKRRSARKDVTPPPGLADAQSIKTFAYDTVGAAKNRNENLEKFDKLFSAK
ncbi:MAG: extracellular solute-binding protein [Alphaproteobacteria bacterium]|nr:extracellular solute-binding protein [Alphaproteobacteria bacterium]